MNNNVNIKASEDLYQELVISHPRLEKIQAYLEQGADINYQLPSTGFTPLMQVTINKNVDLVKFLLSKGANPLIKNKQHKIASDLIESKTAIYQFLCDQELFLATVMDRLSEAKQALAKGANVDVRGPDNYTPLLVAVERSNVPFVELLMHHNANRELRRQDGKGIISLIVDPFINMMFMHGKPFTEEEKQDMERKRLEFKRIDEARTEAYEKHLIDKKNRVFNLSQLKFYLNNKAEFVPTEAEFKALEQHFGHNLPPMLKEIYQNYNGCRFKLDNFSDDDGDTVQDFYTVTDLNNRDSWDIWKLISSYAEDLGPNTLPFAKDIYNRILYLKWVDGTNQVWRVAYGDEAAEDPDEEYEDDDDNFRSFDLIAESFEEFLESLYAAE